MPQNCWEFKESGYLILVSDLKVTRRDGKWKTAGCRILSVHEWDPVKNVTRQKHKKGEIYVENVPIFSWVYVFSLLGMVTPLKRRDLEQSSIKT